MGIVHRLAERIRAVATDDDPAPVQADPRPRTDITRIADTLDRQRATVQGRVSALTLPTKSSVPALVLDVTDASGVMELVFVGRKAIPGIETGTTLRANGRVSIDSLRRVMYNPAYEIVPRRGH